MTSIKDLKPDSHNANRGSARGQKQIVGSIQRNGFGRSGLLDKDGRVIAGNKTLEASAEVFGVEAAVIIVESDGTKPVYVKRTDLDLDDPAPNNPARRLAYEDNVSSWLSFDLDPAVVMADMESGFDFEAIGVSLEELGEMLEGSVAELLGGGGQDNAPPPDDPGPLIDKAEELQKKWQVNPGDIWTIGPHKIICGDCREPETWGRLLEGVKLNGVFTSPPYAEQRKKQYGGVPTAEYVAWWEAVQENVRGNLAGDGSFFVNIKPHCEDRGRSLYVVDIVTSMARQWNWLFMDEFCWLRPGVPKQVVRHFKNGFEPVYQFTQAIEFKFNPDDVRHYSDNVPIPGGPGVGETNWAGLQGKGGLLGKTKGVDTGLAYPSNVIKANSSDAHGHEAAFPLALPTFFLKAYSDPGDSWLDPFLGSGTTICAAHNEGRVGYGIERLEKYVSVCLERLQQLTSRDPIRVSG